jgi:integrase
MTIMDLFEYAAREADREPGETPDDSSAPALCDAPVAPRPLPPAGAAATPCDLRETVVTLADALRAAETMPGVPAGRLADWRSAVATCCRVTGAKPEETAIAPRTMVPLLRAVRPGLYRLKAKRWGNVRASLAGLAAAAGWHAGRERLRLVVTGEWAVLRESLPHSPQKANFSGFARHCQVEGITPEEVTEETVAAYRTWLETWTYDLHAAVTIHGLRRIWNRHAGATPGWPARKLPAPKDPRIFALPLEDFPEGFRTELEGFTALMREPDPFDEKASRPLADQTVRDRRGHLIRAASILVLAGLKTPGDFDGLKPLVEPGAVKAVLRHMRTKAGGKWNGNSEEVALVLHDVARRWLKLDPGSLEALAQLRAAVKSGPRGIGKRSLRRLEAFDDPIVLKRFFRLPGELFKAADRLQAEDRPDQAARLHERALALAILQLQPLRRRTLALIDIDSHLRRDPRGRFVTLSMPGELVKNGVEISAPLPDDLARRLAKHVRVHLPRLRDGKGGTWLFPGDTPTGHKDPQTLAKTVTKEVERALGVPFSLHLVRHIAAMVLYDSSPDAGPVAQRLLAHRQLSTTESFYGRLKTRSAHREWGDVLDRLRAKERAKASGAKAAWRKGNRS